MGSAGKACPHTMTADESEAGELALEPLLTCKLCLCEYSLDKMTTLQECSCIFCTACLKQYMELAIQEGCGSPITCPDMVCLNHGTLQEAEIACLVPVDQFELYKRLKFERESKKKHLKDLSDFSLARGQHFQIVFLELHCSSDVVFILGP